MKTTSTEDSDTNTNIKAKDTFTFMYVQHMKVILKEVVSKRYPSNIILTCQMSVEQVARNLGI